MPVDILVASFDIGLDDVEDADWEALLNVVDVDML
jgi:hypothetical protein